MTCNESSGRVVEVEREVGTATDSLFGPKAKVTEEQARRAALAEYPGQLVEAEYEIEANGAASYEFDIRKQGGTDERAETEVEVDAVRVARPFFER